MIQLNYTRGFDPTELGCSSLQVSLKTEQQAVNERYELRLVLPPPNTQFVFVILMRNLFRQSVAWDDPE